VINFMELLRHRILDLTVLNCSLYVTLSRGLFFISECSISNIIPMSKKHVIDGVWMQNKTLP
jgi:hypothetical protein